MQFAIWQVLLEGGSLHSRCATTPPITKLGPRKTDSSSNNSWGPYPPFRVDSHGFTCDLSVSCEEVTACWIPATECDDWLDWFFSLALHTEVAHTVGRTGRPKDKSPLYISREESMVGVDGHPRQPCELQTTTARWFSLIPRNLKGKKGVTLLMFYF